MEAYHQVLKFLSVDQILWYNHSNQGDLFKENKYSF